MDQLTAMRQKMLLKKKKGNEETLQLNKKEGDQQKAQVLQNNKKQLQEQSKKPIENIKEKNLISQDNKKESSNPQNQNEQKKVSLSMNSFDQLRKKLLETKKLSRNQKQPPKPSNPQIQQNNLDIKPMPQEQDNISSFSDLSEDDDNLDQIEQDNLSQNEETNHLKIMKNPLGNYYCKKSAIEHKILIKQLYQFKENIQKINTILSKTNVQPRIPQKTLIEQNIDNGEKQKNNAIKMVQYLKILKDIIGSNQDFANKLAHQM